MHAIYQALKATEENWIRFRHDLHQHPETGFAEVRTSRLVAAKLKEFGFSVHQGMAKTGVIATLKAGDGKKVLGLRAEMDALPMAERRRACWLTSLFACPRWRLFL